MGGFLGVLAGLGMLLFVAALFAAFLRQIGALTGARCRFLLRGALGVLGAGGLYWLGGGLMYNAVHEHVSLSQINTIFNTAGLSRMYEALQNPSWFAPLSGLFAFLGHGLGAALLGRYLLGGMVLALSMTGVGACLFQARLRALAGERAAGDGVFLLLSLPGAVFLYLPGSAPLIFLLLALAFFFLGKRLRPREITYDPNVYSTVLAISAVLSAAVVFLAVSGRLA